MDAPNLTRQLLRHAQRSREPVRLSMAFKAQNPEWGSQATLVAIGVTNYLHHVCWDLSQVTLRFPDWLEEAQAFHAPHLMTLRTTQIHALSRMVDEPRRVTFRPAPGNDDKQMLMHLLASHGLLLSDVRQLLRHDSQHPDVRLWVPAIGRHPAAQDLWESHRQDLVSVSLDDYLSAVHPEDQDAHPNVLYATVLRHWKQLGKLSAPLLTHYQDDLQPSLLVHDTLGKEPKDCLGRLKA